MFRLQVKSHFDAAHYIRDYQGKCNRMHGHRWEVEVVVEGVVLDDRNILVDFGEVKGTLKGYLDEKCDHYILNDTFSEPNITAEFLAKHIYDDMGLRLARIGDGWAKLVRVTVWESPECCVKYSPDMASIRG